MSALPAQLAARPFAAGGAAPPGHERFSPIGGGWGVQADDGVLLTAPAVVVAADPVSAARLTGSPHRQ
jgi:hypothetical protein